MPYAWEKYIVDAPESPRMPRLTRRIFIYGPEELRLRENLIPEGGPDQFVRNNPGLFATGTTSRDEGYFYWGLLKRVGEEGTKGHLGITWYYQSSVAGGRHRPGGAIIDFLLEVPSGRFDLGIRIVTPYRHTFAGPLKRGTDDAQVLYLRRQGIQAVDVFSKNYIGDPSGRAVIQSVDRAIAGDNDFSPLYHRNFGP